MKYYGSFNELYNEWETKNQNPDVTVFNDTYTDTVQKLSKTYAQLLANAERLFDLPLDSNDPEYMAVLKLQARAAHLAKNEIAYQRDPKRSNQPAEEAAKFLDSDVVLVKRVRDISRKLTQLEKKYGNKQD